MMPGRVRHIDRIRFQSIRTGADQGSWCSQIDGARQRVWGGTFVGVKVHRSTTPPAVCLNVNSRRLDNPTRVSLSARCRRCRTPLQLRHHIDDTAAVIIEKHP